jgi:PEGA domain-containing protein
MRPPTAIAVATLVTVAIMALQPHTAFAQRRGRAPHSVVFVGGYFYDPFFGPYPWWPPAAYGYPYFPVYDDRAQVRLLVTPKEAAVYVDGYYAGIVDDFDGVFQRLPLSPGPHDITVVLDGYRIVHQKLFLTRNKTYKLRYAMQPLAAGEQSEPPPVAPPVPPPPPGSAMLPRTPRPGQPAPELPSPAGAASAFPASGFGTLALRVQPVDAEILIDGERWTPASLGERLLVQVPEGRHHIEIQKPGYGAFSTDITVQRGETAPMNVSLSTQN